MFFFVFARSNVQENCPTVGELVKLSFKCNAYNGNHGYQYRRCSISILNEQDPKTAKDQMMYLFHTWETFVKNIVIFILKDFLLQENKNSNDLFIYLKQKRPRENP